VGRFVTTRALRCADLTGADVCDFADSDEKLDEFLIIRSIDQVFSVPVVPEDKGPYHFSQLLADAFRHLGFDAICYRSSVGKGKNYAFFDPRQLTCAEGSARVVRIDGLVYTISDTTPMGDDDDYHTDPDGSFW
jgi:hypothetical protein